MMEYEGERKFCSRCGYPVGAPAEDPRQLCPGFVLSGRYLVGKAIRFGEAGVDYLGWDQISQCRVAVREYFPLNFALRGVGAADAVGPVEKGEGEFTNGLNRFLETGRLLWSLQNETGLLHVTDVVQENGTAYCVMEYPEGEVFVDYLTREGPVEENEAVGLFLPVISSMEMAHRIGLLHLGISVDRLYRTTDGKLKLFGFFDSLNGYADVQGVDAQDELSEEQWDKNGELGPYTDVYGMGAALYRTLTGTPLPLAKDRAAAFRKKKEDPLLPLSALCPVSENRENAVKNALNIFYPGRTPTMEGFWHELTQGEPVILRAESPIKHKKKKKKIPLGVKIGVPAGAGALLLLGAALMVFLPGGPLNFLNPFGAGGSRVPDVRGCSVSVAQDMLFDQSFAPLIRGRETSDTVAANMISSQSPEPGEPAEPGTQVEITVSEGEELEVEDGVMPDVSFYSEEEARGILSGLGAETETEYEESSDVAKGLVMYASLNPGDTLNAGDKVILTVCGEEKAPLLLEELNDDAQDQAGGRKTENEGKDIQVNRSVLNLFVGDEAEIKATGGNGTFTWKSEDGTVASVKEGKVTALKAGSTTITVTSGKKSQTCKVIVQDYKIALNPKEAAMFLGDTLVLVPTGQPKNAALTWKSGNSAVAEVNNGKVTAKGIGSTAITVEFSMKERKYQAVCQIKVSDSGVVLSQNTGTLYVGETLTLTATTSPSGKPVQWESGNTRVATVSSSGLVTAVGEGTAKITAKFTQGSKVYSESCTVTVKRVSIRMIPTSLTMQVEEEYYLAVETVPSGQAVKWSSSSPSVVKMDRSKITALAEGSATMTVSMTFKGKEYSASCSVTVKAPTIDITNCPSSMYVGDSGQLSASTSNGKTVSWSSSDDRVVTVSGGKVQAQGQGTATVTASMVCGGKTYSDSRTVTVEEPSISLSQSSMELEVGGSSWLEAYYSPSSASLQWSSSDNGVVTVNNGQVTAVGPGYAIITAVITYPASGYLEYSADCSVTVEEPYIGLSDSSLTMEVGAAYTLQASTSPSGCAVFWSSSDSSVAYVDQYGGVYAQGKGSAVITASITIGGGTYSSTCTVQVLGSPESGVTLEEELEYS